MNNTHRKRKSCHKSPLSAGNMSLTSCPPALNASVKRALLKEIKNFDANEARKESESSAEGGASQDAYNTWLAMNGGHEPVEANPDILSEAEGITFIPTKIDNVTVRILKEARQLFSARENQAWNLIMKHSLSYQEAADIMNVALPTVQNYVKRAKAKFIKFAQEIKRVNES